MSPSDRLTLTPIEGTDPNRQLYALQGPLTLADLLTVQEALASPASVLVLDLSGVPYVDSAGVGVLVQSTVSRKRKGQRLAVVAPNETVKKLFSLTMVDSVLEIYPSLDAVK